MQNIADLLILTQNMFRRKVFLAISVFLSKLGDFGFEGDVNFYAVIAFQSVQFSNCFVYQSLDSCFICLSPDVVVLQYHT